MVIKMVSALSQPDRFGRRVSDDTFLVLFNAHHEDLQWKIPSQRWGTSWVSEIDTAAPDGRARSVRAGRTIVRPAHSTIVLRTRLPHRSIGGITEGR
jgi:glycogen operon protein